MLRTVAAFAWEPLDALLDDGIAEAVEAEWREVAAHKGDMPLAVDWGQYRKLEAAGILKVMALREDDRLVGFNSFMVMPHLHYSQTIHAMNDAIYVRPDSRGLSGLRLILGAERALRAFAAPRPIRVIYYTKETVILRRGSGDSLDMLDDLLDLEAEFGVKFDKDIAPLVEGTVGDVLNILGYRPFETAYDKMVGLDGDRRGDRSSGGGR